MRLPTFPEPLKIEHDQCGRAREVTPPLMREIPYKGVVIHVETGRLAWVLETILTFALFGAFLQFGGAFYTISSAVMMVLWSFRTYDLFSKK